jgi:choline-sulfatase
MSGGRPNILLVMADQLAAPFLRPYGDSTAIAPAIDRLAAGGVVFEAAYSQSPLCAPARFGMMSGQLNSRIGAYDNASEFTSSVPTFVHHLRSGGYQTSLIGKMHFVGSDQLHGYEERLTTDIYPSDFGWTPNWDDPDRRFDRWMHNMESVVHAGVAEASNQLDFDDDVGFQAVRKLRDLARTPDDRPWFLTVSFTHPHDPYVARREFWDRYDHDSIPMPSVPELDVDQLDPHSRRLRTLMAYDAAEITDEHIRAARHAYYANISYVDDHIGRIVDLLDRLGMADDTVVLFVADHGDMLGERGLWYKMTFYEHSARVPMILYSPDRFAPGRVAAPTSLLDVAPTLLEVAGLDRPESFDGSSMLSLLETDDPERTVRGEYLGEGAVAPIFMIRRGDLKYVWSVHDPPQLYDLSTDPAELTNLAAEAGWASMATALAAEVAVSWDVARIDADVRASQRDRATVDRALRQRRYHPWDFQPTTEAAGQYMRNHLDLNDVESGRRI